MKIDGYGSSSIWVGTPGVSPTRHSQDNRYFTPFDMLTASDKQLVKAAGWDVDADPEGIAAPEGAKKLAGRIAMDRHCGSITGVLDKHYIQGIVDQQRAGAPELVPFDVLFNALSYFDKTIGSMRPGQIDEYA